MGCHADLFMLLAVKWVRPIIKVPEMHVVLFMISKILSQTIKFCVKVKDILYDVMNIHKSMPVKTGKMISVCVISSENITGLGV